MTSFLIALSMPTIVSQGRLCVLNLLLLEDSFDTKQAGTLCVQVDKHSQHPDVFLISSLQP